MDVGLVLQLVAIAFLWGGTNPLIKKGTKDIKRVEDGTSGFITRFLKEVSFLFLNWRYLVPFGLNQIGSLLFFFVLQKYDLNIIVPVTNSLSYAFTCLVGYFVGESSPSKRTCLGLVLIMAGTMCFLISKTETEREVCATIS